MKKKIIIVGAGGLGRIVYEVLRRDPAIVAEWELAGFLDTRPGLRLPPDIALAVLGSPLDYQPSENELFISAVGSPSLRQTLLAPLQKKDAQFFSYSQQASIGARTSIGTGSFLTPGVVVSVDCRIGAHAYLDTQTIFGHDVQIGDHCMIGAMSFLAGGVRLGHRVAVNPRAVIAKDIKVGDGATVGIGSVVIKDVPPGATVFGNPARIIFA